MIDSQEYQGEYGNDNYVDHCHYRCCERCSLFSIPLITSHRRVIEVEESDLTEFEIGLQTEPENRIEKDQGSDLVNELAEFRTYS